MRTGFVWHERLMWHDTGSFANYLPAGGMGPLQPDVHVENSAAKRRMKNLLDVLGVTEQLTAISPRLATEDDLARVHEKAYIEMIQRMSEAGGGDAGGLTPFAQDGYQIACLAAGGLIELIDALISRQVENGYALVRPPGHHALPETGWGFCIFNNGAIGAKYAQEIHNLSRIAILDWDVHHGNGTQATFYEDPSVLTICLHQTGSYPLDSGLTEENGAGAGVGANLNINIPPGAGHAAYLYALDTVVLPALYRYRPDLIIVASGFDAGGMDPLGRMLCDGETFRALAAGVISTADDLCDGRIVMTHEGGYSPAHVPFCGLAVLEALSGIDTGIKDPFLEALSGQGGYELLPHQRQSIDESVALLEGVPTP